ncbi:sulfur carrier protein ThiS [Nocardiopsis coralliicola]
MEITVNGEHRAYPDGSTVGDVVRALTQAPGGVAAAVNDAVVRRGSWDSAPLADGDRVDVVTAVQGG